MRISESRIRQIIRQEAASMLHKESSVRHGGNPLYDEERRLIGLVRELSGLFDDLRHSHRTEEVQDMEDAYTQALRDIRSQKLRHGGVYILVGLARAFVDMGIRDGEHDDAK